MFSTAVTNALGESIQKSDTPRVDELDFNGAITFPGPGYGMLWELARKLERESSGFQGRLDTVRELIEGVLGEKLGSPESGVGKLVARMQAAERAAQNFADRLNDMLTPEEARILLEETDIRWRPNVADRIIHVLERLAGDRDDLVFRTPPMPEDAALDRADRLEEELMHQKMEEK